jgi:C4-dicarboxylate transporter DctM subunit
VVVTLNLAICTITPPIAVNLYVASNISGPSMAEVSRWILPFFTALMVVLALVIAFPSLSLWLPNALGIR